tara:strand:- start:3419 stop:4516 length:1098 start_codon:yes stop_codon:yes gene_type:complete
MDFFTTGISAEAKKKVNEVLESNFISAGKVAEEFETQLKDKLGLINPVTLNSGTSALHLALDIAGISTGDEVIIPPQTFIATGLAVLMQRAIPVFADIQPETGNIDPHSIEKKITEKTKAIIPVHWGGYPCDMDEINQIAKKYNLDVIEDAAHALGATYKNRPVGSLSAFTAFSFQAIKSLTTGDGGALCICDYEKYKMALRKRWFGIDRENSKPSIIGERVFDIEDLGYKYHLNDFSAALGLGNLSIFDKSLRRRIEIANLYRKNLSNVPRLKLLDYADDRQSSFWLFTILVEDRLGFIKNLDNEGIPSSVVHLRIDSNQVFGGLTKNLKNMEIFNENQVSIPIHSNLSDKDVEKIINTIRGGW